MFYNKSDGKILERYCLLFEIKELIQNTRKQSVFR
jgi:hypothetical protein